MNLLVTGLHGTLGLVLARRAEALGASVLRWDRRQVDPEDRDASRRWLETNRPDAIAHLANGSPGWAGGLAAYAAEREIPFLFTSSAMVFHHEPDGPHAPRDPRTAEDDYGRYKITCEDAVRAAHPAAMIARIGWQIDPHQPGNNMLMQLDRRQTEGRFVPASALWRPACSFMEDTADALFDLCRNPSPGVVHLDSNAVEGHGFDAIVGALRDAFARYSWVVRRTQEYRHDQRLIGHEGLLPPLSARLPLLRR